MAKNRRKGAKPPQAGERSHDTHRSGPLRDQYPTIFAFGEGPIEYLTIEQAQAATPAERIKSVWPFLVRSTLKFCDSLRRRAAINFDPEDVLTELWIVLAEKDAKWEPARGPYLSFAGRVITNELHQIRDRAGTIQGPRNATCRVKQYERERAVGTLTEKKAATLRDIRRAFADHESLEPETAGRIVTRSERLEPDELAAETRLRRQIGAALLDLPSAEAAVIGRSFGFYDGKPRDIISIAEELNQDPNVVKKLKARGLRLLQESLRDVLIA
jgi:hypothetical protein